MHPPSGFRCETEERTTRRLEQQVALLREAKREADESSVTLQAECHRSMTELQHMDQEFEVRPSPLNFFFFHAILSILFEDEA